MNNKREYIKFLKINPLEEKKSEYIYKADMFTCLENDLWNWKVASNN